MNEGALCPEDRMEDILARMARDLDGGMGELRSAVGDFPNDARLLFLYGSVAAGAQEYGEAREAMRRAVDLAPKFHIARFQLGLLLLSSGEPFAAQEAWGPLHSLSQDNYLRIFVNGLCRLIQDDFGDAIRLLEEGITLNRENTPMNRDMQMIIDEIQAKQNGGTGGGASSVDLLLRQAALKSTRH